MSYTVAYCKIVKVIPWRGSDHLEVLCRVTCDLKWIKTERVRVPYPIYMEELEHDLMCELDVGNVRIQQHLEIHIPREYPEMVD